MHRPERAAQRFPDSLLAIRGTFCDLATKNDGALQMLIEVKAIDLDLKESHVKQAIDYAANQGVDWVVLTNAISWRVYKVTFAKPINQELVIDIDFCNLNPKSAKDIELLLLFCKEGWIKSVLGEYHTQKQALSRFFIGAMIAPLRQRPSDSVASVALMVRATGRDTMPTVDGRKASTRCDIE